MSVEQKNMQNKLPLPAERMPECWNQDERMNALFSPFRSKSANPQDWMSKYKFWQNLIYEWLKYSMICSFSIIDLNETFKRNNCTPLCLTAVVEELHRNNEIITEFEFLKEPNNSWTTWSIDILVKRPLSWSISKMKSYVVNSEINKESRYIHIQAVRELGDTILSILKDNNEHILMSFGEIVNYYKLNINKNMLDNTLMLAVIFIRRQGRITVKNSSNDNELLIKLAQHPMDNITEIEESLYKITKLENELLQEMQTMEQEKINIIDETKLHLSKGLRQLAKTHLRKKLELEKAIQQKAQTLENLQTLISSLKETYSNTAVLSAYKVGCTVLKKLNEYGLSESNVRDIMDDLAESLGEHKEVQSILSENLKNNDSDIDFEEELAELLKLEDTNFPTTPSTKLDSTVEELEQTMKSLHVEDSIVSDKSSSKVASETRYKGKSSANPVSV